MFRHWWFLRLLGSREPGPAAGSARGRGDGGRRRMTREQQEAVLQEWRVLRERLRGFAAERVALVGDVMRAAEPDFPAELATGPAGAAYLWAVEAYQAAGKLLDDDDADLPDLAAAVVLAERAVERLAAAHERLALRRPTAAAQPRCFYNPLHGPAVVRKPKGTKKQARRRVSPQQAAADRRPGCEQCRLAILAGQLPDVLPALLTVRRAWHRTRWVLVPYYALPQHLSPWSATACGAYDDTAPALVLRGDHRKGRTAPPPP
ncbi:hypothetical protein LN042_06645 [Kitasatospora sp. RB6PN24]|uniref:hypothetical protein n=1 Tax=Kitasatospora humi TaxID=2893891 RepID=UPI001E5CA7CD|nr:hypothetical protein [Kitasatospora humi]MCC9306786.1 hypothetical protein [Kitasatospora humi]